MSRLEVRVLDRGHIRTDVNHVVEGAVIGSAAVPGPETRIGEGPVYNLLIDHPEGTILWDTGSHPEAGEGYWPEELYDAFEHYDADEHPLDVALDRAGRSIEEIDAVIQSHLHLDHAGGLYNFAGTDVPIYVHEAELKHAYYGAKADADDAYLASDFDHDLNWRVVHRERETPFKGIELLHLPGHTPGLMGLRLETGEGTVLVAGDQAYVRANYDGERPLGAGLLWGKRAWYDSLRRLQELERRGDAAVVCGHDGDGLERFRGGQEIE